MRSKSPPLKKTELSKGGACALVALTFLVLVPLSTLYRALVLTVLWGWFVVPTTGWPSITIWTAIGLSALSFLFSQRTGAKADEEAQEGEDPIDSFITAVFTAAWIPTACLAFGAVAHAFQ